MPPRFFVDQPLHTGETLELPSGASRHAQVLRLQPGDTLTLYDGRRGEFAARVLRMGRRHVDVDVQAFDPVERELPIEVLLAFGMPANERMDYLVEKATELGVAALQPLVCERSVLRVSGERAEKKRQHWQAVAVAASEQSGRTRVPQVAGVAEIGSWLDGLAANAAPAEEMRCHVLSLRNEGAPRDRLTSAPPGTRLCFLSGPEGGLTEAEEAAACSAGFDPLSLGSRVLRADTAPLAALALVALGDVG